MKIMKVLFLTLFGFLAASLLLGCLNPVSFNAGQAEPESVSASKAADWEPFTVTLTINGDGSASMDGGGSARAVAGLPGDTIKGNGNGARNYMQLIVAQNGQIQSISENRQTAAGGGASFSPNVSSGNNYDFLFLMGHWERDNDGTPYQYKNDLPTLLAAGFTSYSILPGSNTVTITMYPLVVETKFTSAASSAVENQAAGVFPLIPGTWTMEWNVTNGAGGINPFDKLVEAQKKITGQASNNTLLLKSQSAVGSSSLTGGNLAGHIFTQPIGTYKLPQTGTTGNANFKLEYVPFGVLNSVSWPSNSVLNKINGVPVWIIRNGVNDTVQNSSTDFSTPNDWAAGSKNGNGAARWTIAPPKGPGADGVTLAVTGGASTWTAGENPKIGFTLGGDTGNAEVYYEVVAKDGGVPSNYSGYTFLNNYNMPGVYPMAQEITLDPSQTGAAYDVWVIIYKDGRVSNPYKITIEQGSTVIIETDWA
jgi:hypothetical protein